jgi:non-heme chloroperoxidase
MSAASAFKTGEVTLSDGVRLSYLEAGTGEPVVMVPGWSQTEIEFKHRAARGSPTSRITAIVCRVLPWICAKCSTRLVSTR